MNTRFLSTSIITAVLFSFGQLLYCGSSGWVSVGKDGRLVYKTTPSGDKIMDFSFAGYMNGGVALPDVPVVRTIRPSMKEDDSQLIQDAVDAVAQLPIRNGFRGAILLEAGVYQCSKTIFVPANDIVIRGSGSGKKSSTIISMTGPRHIAFIVGSQRKRSSNVQSSEFADPSERQGTSEPQSNIQTTITDSYVPSGTNTFTVADPSNFSIGDIITIKRPVTPAWVAFMHMDDMKRDGKPQTWIGTSRYGEQERTIISISGNTFTVDVPLSDSYDARYLNPPGTMVVKEQPSDGVTQVGIEHLRIECPAVEIDYDHALYSAIRIVANDCWVNDVVCDQTMNSLTMHGNRITIRRVTINHTFPNLGASKPGDFGIEGSQILIDRCSVTGDNEYFVWTSTLIPGPNVVLNSTFNGYGSRIQPHQRWSTGLLIDNCRVPEGGIDFPNRGVAGSGHGWTMGWGVAWNCFAKTYVIQNPPGVYNWAIGCTGERVTTARYFDTAPILPEGIFESHGERVSPQSLYLAQLSERLGTKALHNIGYQSNSPGDFGSFHLLPAPKPVVDKELGTDLAVRRPVNPNNIRNNSREFGAENALDGNEATYWATDDNVAKPSIIVDTEGPLDINATLLEEAPEYTGNILEYTIEGQVNSDWVLLAHGTTIGNRKVDRFAKTTVWKVRFTVLKKKGTPAIRKFGFFLK